MKQSKIILPMLLILVCIFYNYCDAQIDGNCISAVYYTKLVPTGNDKRINSVCAACFTDDYFSISTPEYGTIKFKIDQQSITRYGGENGVYVSFLNEEDDEVSKWYYQVNVYYGYPHSVTFTFTQQGTTIEIKNSHWEGESDLNKNTNTFQDYISYGKSQPFCDCGNVMPSRVFDSVYPAIKINKGAIKNESDTIKFINILAMQSYRFNKDSDIQFGYSAKISSLLNSTIFKGKKFDTILELIPVLNYDQTLRYLELDEHYNDRTVLIDGEKYPEALPGRRPCFAFLITKYSKYRAAIEQVQRTLIAHHFKWSYTSIKIPPNIDSSHIKKYRIIALPIFIRFPSVLSSH